MGGWWKSSSRASREQTQGGCRAFESRKAELSAVCVCVCVRLLMSDYLTSVIAAQMGGRWVSLVCRHCSRKTNLLVLSTVQSDEVSKVTEQQWTNFKQMVSHDALSRIHRWKPRKRKRHKVGKACIHRQQSLNLGRDNVRQSEGTRAELLKNAALYKIKPIRTRSPHQQWKIAEAPSCCVTALLLLELEGLNSLKKLWIQDIISTIYSTK